MKIFIHGELAEIVTTESENIYATLDRKMTLLRRVNRQIARSRSQTTIYGRLMRAVASTLQRDQVCFRSATRQNAKTLRSVTNQLAKPAQHARFDHCRGGTVAPGAGVLV